MGFTSPLKKPFLAFFNGLVRQKTQSPPEGLTEKERRNGKGSGRLAAFLRLTNFPLSFPADFL